MKVLPWGGKGRQRVSGLREKLVLSVKSSTAAPQRKRPCLGGYSKIIKHQGIAGNQPIPPNKNERGRGRLGYHHNKSYHNKNLRPRRKIAEKKRRREGEIMVGEGGDPNKKGTKPLKRALEE